MINELIWVNEIYSRTLLSYLPSLDLSDDPHEALVHFVARWTCQVEKGLHFPRKPFHDTFISGCKVEAKEPCLLRHLYSSNRLCKAELNHKSLI